MYVEYSACIDQIMHVSPLRSTPSKWLVEVLVPAGPQLLILQLKNIGRFRAVLGSVPFNQNLWKLKI
jgi:hypothetical protein